jgi:PKD repeat protein
VVGFYADPYAGTFDSPDPLNSSWAFENTSDNGQAIWDFGDGELSSEWSTNHTYDAAGTYEVILMVMNEHGCAEEFTMFVEVLENLEVYVPNAFTPPMQGYSDGINDGWKPVLSNPSLVGRYDLVVYNRYGQKVWETKDPEMHWVGEARVDGAYFAPGGMYTWVLQIDSRAFPESSRQWKGQVNLLR